MVCDPMNDATRKLHIHLLECGARKNSFAASLVVICRGDVIERWMTGRTAKSAQSSYVTADTRFLVASLSKPVSATAIMRLVDDKVVELSTPVYKLLPEFKADGKDEIEIQHLLNHTSGLPDMVAANILLRERHADLADFYLNVCNSPLCFRPGSDVGYQSMGFLVLAQLVERLTSQKFADFAERELFGPIGMAHSSFGARGDLSIQDTVLVDLPSGQVGTNWHWNSEYWRRLGAPWGGLLSTATDLAAFAHIFVNDGCSQSGRRVLSSANCTAMLRNWIGSIAPVCPPLGLGWFIRGETCVSKPVAAGPDGTEADTAGVVTARDIVFDRAFFGTSFSSRAVGHAGVTGCAMWADPASGMAAALLTNIPSALNNGTISGAADIIGKMNM